MTKSEQLLADVAEAKSYIDEDHLEVGTVISTMYDGSLVRAKVVDKTENSYTLIRVDSNEEEIGSTFIRTDEEIEVDPEQLNKD